MTHTITCRTCDDDQMLTCPDCRGTSLHWCYRDAAAAATGSAPCDPATYTEPTCDTCECTGQVSCPECLTAGRLD